MEIKSKKDFVKVLFDLIEDEHVSFDIYDTGELYTRFTLRDREISGFFSDLATLDNLYGRGSITEKMFDDWKEEAIERIEG